jgi:hypothetical protein
MGAALATFLCYLFMMVVSYYMGQQHYPVPYAVKKLITYMVIVVLFWGIQRTILYFFPHLWLGILIGFISIGLFSWLVWWAEQKEFTKLFRKAN